MVSPVISHVPCALDQQRRLREAREASLTRGRKRRRRVEPTADLAAALGARSEDVWQALRF